MIQHQGKDYKVVVVTPAGREKMLCILRKYIERDMVNGLIDEWQLWLNTSIYQDIAYIESMQANNNKVHIKTVPGTAEYSMYNIHKFFQFAQDADTIYLRFDDDIVFIEEGAIKKLLEYRLMNQNPIAICANIVDNTLISNIHQNIGVLGKELGECTFERLDPLGWADPQFIELIHKTFIENYNNKTLHRYYFTPYLLRNYEPFSISCFAWMGRTKLQPPVDEEMWISSQFPSICCKQNVIYGDALVVHYAYHTQREHLDSKPEYYNFYKELSEHI